MMSLCISTECSRLYMNISSMITHFEFICWPKIPPRHKSVNTPIGAYMVYFKAIFRSTVANMRHPLPAVYAVFISDQQGF